MTDITYAAGGETFNYRACAVIINRGRVLAMHDGRSPYFYLPGGRVKLGETAEEAVCREVMEEVGVRARISRPLWLNQAFFTEDVDGRRFHELCLYFLMEPENWDALGAKEAFERQENGRTNRFEWLAFERLEKEYFYPFFLKKAIFDLPETLTLRTERE